MMAGRDGVCCHGYVPYRTRGPRLWVMHADCTFCRENMEKDGMGVRGLAGDLFGLLELGCRWIWEEM